MAKSNKTHFWVKSLYLLFSPPLSLFLQINLCYFHFGLSSYQFISFRPLFTNYKFALKYCTISGFLNFHVLHLNHETFKLCLLNTLNISKTTRVYFGELHRGRPRGTGQAPPEFDQPPAFDHQAFVEAVGIAVAAIAQVSAAGSQGGPSNL